MSPAFPRMMHICFHIRDDVDFNKFIADLEAESARRGMTQVRANRVITVTVREGAPGRADRRQQQRHHRRQVEWLEADLLQGSEGEQLEFVQALGPVKRTFDDALQARRRCRVESVNATNQGERECTRTQEQRAHRSILRIPT